VIGIDYIGSCKSNYHTITTTPFVTEKHRRQITTFIDYQLDHIWFEISVYGYELQLMTKLRINPDKHSQNSYSTIIVDN
jgi:hypothetical protein